MKTTIAQFKSALAKILHSMDTKNIQAEFKPGVGFYLHGYSNGAHARAVIGVEDGGTEKFVVSLSGKLINGIFSGLSPETSISIKQVEKGIEFRFGGAKIVVKEIKELDLENFEHIETEPTLVAEIKSSDFSKALKSVVNFTAKDDSRFHLRGVYIHADIDSNMVLAGTDGFRLAVNNVGVKLNDDSDGVILHNEFAKGLSDIYNGDEVVKISFIQDMLELNPGSPKTKVTRRAIFETDDFVLDAPLLCGKYPNYNKVIPADVDAKLLVELDQSTLLGAAERISLVSGEGYLRTYFGENAVVIKSQDEESSESVDYQFVTRSIENHYNGFTSKYLISGINYADSGKIKLSVFDGKLLIRGENPNWKAVVMAATI